MKNRKVIIPKNKNEVFELLDNYKNSYYLLLGGTDILVREVKNLLDKDKIFIDLNSLSDNYKIKEDDKNVYIGLDCRHSDIYENTIFKHYFYALYQATQEVGARAIQNRGTIIGNVCNASPAGDTIPALMVFDAKLKIESKNENRVVNINDFIEAPGKTILKDNEFVTEIIIPKIDNVKSAFLKLGQRKALAISKINCAVSLRIENNKVLDCKIAFGSVFKKVIRAEKIEKKIINMNIDDLKNNIQDIVKEAKDVVKPIDDIRSTAEYRKDMAPVLLKRAILQII